MLRKVSNNLITLVKQQLNPVMSLGVQSSMEIDGVSNSTDLPGPKNLPVSSSN